MVPGRRFSDRVERSLGVGGGKKRWGRVVVDVLWTARIGGKNRGKTTNSHDEMRTEVMNVDEGHADNKSRGGSARKK